MSVIAAQRIAQMFGSHKEISEIANQAGRLPGHTASPELKEALSKKGEEALKELYRNYFQTAESAKTPSQSGRMAQLFSALSPAEAKQLAELFQMSQQGYTSGKPDQRPASQNGEKQPLFSGHYNQGQAHKSKQQQTRTILQNVNRMQNQTQNFVSDMIGSPKNTGDRAKFLGPTACFEDVLMELMMKIARQEEKKVTEKIRVLERGHNGLNGVFNSGAKKLGGITAGALGGALGGYMSGATGATTGAAVGQDIGERLVGSYDMNNTPESRQMQFEKVKHMMQKQSEMMTAISNILSTIHKTNQNTIGNIRG